MPLRKAVQSASHTGQRITFDREDGNPVDLTGATVTARIKNVETGAVVDSDGAFAVPVTAKMNQFLWAYGTTDVATAGRYTVQFTATYPDTTAERSFHEPWEVVEAF